MKIAICFSGAARDFETCIPSLKKYLFQNNNIDFFLHLWRSDEIDNIQYEFKWKKYNNNFFKLIKILKPKKYVIEKYSDLWENKILYESKIDITKFNSEDKKNYGFNCCSMYYKIKECYKLVEEYMEEANITYDFIIRARLDFIWEDYFNLDNIDPEKLYLIKDRYATCSKLVTNDKYFAGSPKIMKIMCNIFDYLYEYQEEGLMVEGQVINEHHIKKNNISVNWIGHINTYYKCLPRHRIIKNNINILIENKTYLKVNSELTYYLLYYGYSLYFLNNIDTNEQFLEYFNEFHYFDKIYNLDESKKKEINYISYEVNDDYIIIIINNNKIKVYNNLLIDNNNYKNLFNFINSILENNIKNNYYILAESKEIKNIENNEIIIYKYLDRGYFKLNLIIENNEYIVNFMNSNKKILRNTFKIQNIHKYYDNFILPY
jgi:hypothetical protein